MLLYQTGLDFLKNLWGARNRVGTGLSYWPARLHSLAELVPLKFKIRAPAALIKKEAFIREAFPF